MRGSRLLSLKQNSRALSPVVASIILISIVIAVSIAAATWMGSMSTTFMEVEEVGITDCSWAPDISYVYLTVKNTGTSSVTINRVEINHETATNVSVFSGDSKLDTGETVVFRVIQNFSASQKYEFAVVTASSNRFSVVSTSSSSTFSEETWYSTFWSKRKVVSIDNRLNTENLVGYQLKLNIEYDSDMKQDFSDLRFTGNDYHTPINYWIESYVPSTSAVVWVKVPFITALSTETVYMYYGNPSATSASNADNTFDLFLNFTRDGVISYGGSGQDVNSDQWELINDTTIRMWGNNWKAALNTLTVTVGGSQAICFDYKSVGVQAEINGVGLDVDNSITSNWFYEIYGIQNWGLRDHYGYTGAGDWQFYTIVLDNYSGNFDRFVFTNDADSGQATNVYYRNVRVTQYTSTLPATELGIEETL